jgi:pilus assembly protein CpaB
VTELVEVDRNRLLGIEEKKVEEVEAEKVCTIRSNKGGEIVETVIPCRD